jgi:hypothetical protein
VNSDIFSRKGSLQNLSSYLEVTVSSNSLIENKHPCSEVSQVINFSVFWICLYVELVVVLNKVVELLNSMPQSFCQVTSKALQGVIDIEKCCPEVFKLLLFNSKLLLWIFDKISDVHLQNCLWEFSASWVSILESISYELPVALLASDFRVVDKHEVELHKYGKLFSQRETTNMIVVELNRHVLCFLVHLSLFFIKK